MLQHSFREDAMSRIKIFGLGASYMGTLSYFKIMKSIKNRRFRGEEVSEETGVN